MGLISRNLISQEFIKLRWGEPYVSTGLNQKLFGVLPAGIYHGFSIVPGPGNRQVKITTDDPRGYCGSVSGYSAGNYDVARDYSIAVFSSRQGMCTTVGIESGVSGISNFDLTGYDSQQMCVILRSVFNTGQFTSASIDIVTPDVVDSNPTYLVIGVINLPGVGIPLDNSHIDYDDPVYARTEPFATSQKFGYMRPDYVRKLYGNEQLSFHKLAGGGAISFGVTRDAEWTDAIRVYVPGRPDVFYTPAGSMTFPDNGYMAYVRIPYSNPSGPLTLSMARIEDVVSENVSGVAIPVFYHVLNKLFAGNGSLDLEAGEDAPDGIDTDVPGNILRLLGVNETQSTWGFTNNFPGASTQNAIERWSSLSEDDENLHTDRNIVMGCSGDVAWYATGSLEWLAPIVLHVPSESFEYVLNAGSVSGVVDKACVYVTLDRSGAVPLLTASVALDGALPLDKDNKNHFVIGYRDGQRFVFRNGYVWIDGQVSPFENTVRIDPNVRWDSVMNQMVATDKIFYHQGVSGNIEWTGPMLLKSVSGKLYYEIPAQVISLGDGQVAYVDLDRDNLITPALVWTNLSSVVTSVGAVPWTSGLVAGDWIRKQHLGFSKYYQIDSVDSTTQVTLSDAVVEPSSPIGGDRSVYAKKDLTVLVDDRVNVSENCFWIAMRDDQGAALGRVYFRTIGVLAEGEAIYPNNWVYEESMLVDVGYIVGDLVTLPVDSRNSYVDKYYRVGSGDLAIFVNGAYLLRDKVTVSPNVTITGYDGVSGGYVTFDNATDLSGVERQDYLVDSLGVEIPILGKIDNTVGFKSVYVGLGKTIDFSAGSYIMRQQYTEEGSTYDLSKQIRLRIEIPKNSIMTFRVAPINRPYSDGNGSGPAGGGGSGGGTLQDAYNAGNILSIQSGRPLIVNGNGLSQKCARFIGDIEVTGVIDPTAITFIRQASDPALDKDSFFVTLDGDLKYAKAGSSVAEPVTNSGKNSKSYTNPGASTLSKGRVAVKVAAGQIKYGTISGTEKDAYAIGIITQNIAPGATGEVQRGASTDVGVITNDSFIEGVLPDENSLVFMTDVDGKLSVSPPSRGSGKRWVSVGIWEDGSLLWQIRDFGYA